MSASAWHDAAPNARVLCAGGDLGELIQMQCCLGSDLDFVIVANPSEAQSALFTEAPFDLIILDQRIEQLGGSRFVERLRRHSPDAERLVIVHQEIDAVIAGMIESDCRVMRVLQAPFADEVLCGAVADALLRHRARMMRASAVPRVTPMGGNPCCTSW